MAFVKAGGPSWRVMVNAAVVGTMIAFLMCALEAPSVAASVRCDGHVATIVGTPRGDVLRGTPGNDVIAGLGGYDVIHAGAGHDIVCGGQGADTIFGEQGPDRLFPDRGCFRSADDECEDSASGGLGHDYVRTVAWDSEVTGGPGNDTLINRSGNALFLSERGNDVIRALPGADSVELNFDGSPVGVFVDARRGVVTGRGHTTFRIAKGVHRSITGSVHADVLLGSRHREDISGQAGDDLIRGRGGRDGIEGGQGHDVLFGGGARDYLLFDVRDDVHGGGGPDYLDGGIDPVAGQTIDGGRGVNSFISLGLLRPGPGRRWNQVRIDLAKGRLRADGHVTRLGGRFDTIDVDLESALSWSVAGTKADDRIEVRPFRRQAGVERGRAGNDTLLSGSGDDTLWGGPGRDRASAGLGTDTCHSIEAPLGGQSSTNCEFSSP
jgi:Ca2+-binding RTX toxin-like protein